MSSVSSSALRCDIFCNVIDNYGDIGVCWRLARQLVAEEGCAARLIVDDLAAFARLCPEVTSSAVQVRRGVDIRRWNEFSSGFSPDEVANVVVAAFGCALPPVYLEAMAARAEKVEAIREVSEEEQEEQEERGVRVAAPCWINLEYLSAESWIGECHGLPSPHPTLPLTRYFFFPGFDEHSGGLLREHDLLQRRAAFDRAAWWRSIGAEPPADGIAVSLFAYENPALPGLLRAWEESPVPVVCLVPESRLLASLADYTQRTPRIGDVWRRGALEVRILPFVRQEEYDWLLWACDVNFVRGEDSLVRALWAEKPCVWQIYPQEKGAHYEKLRAFLARYTGGLPLEGPEAVALRSLYAYWNSLGCADGREAAGLTAWQNFFTYLPEVTAHARTWAREQAVRRNLVAVLMAFARQRIWAAG